MAIFAVRVMLIIMVQYDKTIKIYIKTNVREGFEIRHNNSAIAYLRWRIKY